MAMAQLSSNPRVTIADLHKDVDALAKTLGGTPKDWGPAIWKLLHDAVEVIPCDHCREEGRVLMEGIHDIINVFKGEQPERPLSLCFLRNQANKATEMAGICALEKRLMFD